MTVFTPSIPAAGHTLATDQPLMLANFTYLNASLGVDHNVTENTSGTNDGYHTDIHLIPQSAPPQTNGIGQLWAETVPGGDQELFYQSGNGVISQLTAAGITPSPGTNGYTFLPGGILIQWGKINNMASGGTITQVKFNTSNINFPNACFNVSATLSYKGSSGTQNAQTISVATLSATSFYYNYSGGTAYDDMFWIAIGN